jgi:hypothetical protein
VTGLRSVGAGMSHGRGIATADPTTRQALSKNRADYDRWWVASVFPAILARKFGIPVEVR